MILVIDNYDSFTFNLVQYLGEIGQELKVYRNDEITIDEIHRFNSGRNEALRLQLTQVAGLLNNIGIT